MNRIIIKSKNIGIDLDVKFFSNPTAVKIVRSLPFQSKVQKWGEEIYFETGIEAPFINLTTEVNVGDIAYWPEGKCLCIFFGRTPMSTDDKPVPASGVVVVGRTSVDPEILRKVKNGFDVRVE